MSCARYMEWCTNLCDTRAYKIANTDDNIYIEMVLFNISCDIVRHILTLLNHLNKLVIYKLLHKYYEYHSE